jgi:hypothetical protein
MKILELINKIDQIKLNADRHADADSETVRLIAYLTAITHAIMHRHLTAYIDSDRDRELDKEISEAILPIFTELFSVVKGTYLEFSLFTASYLVYLLLEVAQYLAPVLNKSKYQILMPTITVENYISGTSLHDADLRLEDFFLSTDGTRIIEILSVLQFAEEDGILKHTSLFDGKIMPLNADEASKLTTISLKIKGYWQVIQQRLEVMRNSNSYGAVLKRLAAGLLGGGVNQGATETSAGDPANFAIATFAQWYALLSEAERQEFRAYGKQINSSTRLTLAMVIDNLLEPKISADQGLNYCVELLSGNIEQIIAANPQLFDVYPQRSQESNELCLEQLNSRLKVVREQAVTEQNNIKYVVSTPESQHNKTILRRIAQSEFLLAGLVEIPDMLFAYTPDELLDQITVALHAAQHAEKLTILNTRLFKLLNDSKKFMFLLRFFYTYTKNSERIVNLSKAFKRASNMLGYAYERLDFESLMKIALIVDREPPIQYETHYQLGIMFRNGEITGFAKDALGTLKLAKALFEIDALQNDAKAQHNMAMIYFKLSILEPGLKRSHLEQARIWFKKAAAQGLASAATNLVVVEQRLAEYATAAAPPEAPAFTFRLQINTNLNSPRNLDQLIDVQISAQMENNSSVSDTTQNNTRTRPGP